MPIYEYQCGACEHELEVLQKINDKSLRKCPECGKLKLRRLVSAPSFRLKGDGWYETDFKSDKDKKRNLAGDKSPESKSGGNSDSKSGGDKKAARKADNKSGNSSSESSSKKKASNKGSSKRAGA